MTILKNKNNNNNHNNDWEEMYKNNTTKLVKGEGIDKLC